MDITRDAPGKAEAETFGFYAYLLGGSDDEASLPVGLADLTEHMAHRNANAIVAYEDPAIAIAYHLQSGRPLDETLALWQKAAQDHLAACRKAARRIALCQAARGSAEADALTEQLSQRFPGTALPKLASERAAPDAFFVALATLGAERDSATRDLIEEFQARSINPSATPVGPAQNLAILLDRWSAQHALFSGQIRDLKGQTATLTQERDEARKGEQAQGKAAAELNRQVGELETALKTAADDIAMLKAKQESHIEAQQKEAAAHASQIATLTRERDEARKRTETLQADHKTQIDESNQTITTLTRERDEARRGEQAQSETAAVLNRQVGELETALKTTADDVTKLMADQESHLEAQQKETTAHAIQIATLTRERDEARKRTETLQSDHKKQVLGLNALIDEQRHRFNDLHREHGIAQARIETLQSDHKTQVDGLNARIEAQADNFAALTQEREATKARIGTLQADHKTQIGELNASIEAQADTLAALTQERDAAQARIEDFEQTETMLGQQVSELKQALMVTDARCRAVETERQALQQVFGSETADMEQILRDTRNMLATVQGDWQKKLSSRDTLKQHVRQFETALAMIEKRRAEAARDSERLQDQLDSVYASTSWRITTPIRSIKRLVRK